MKTYEQSSKTLNSEKRFSYFNKVNSNIYYKNRVRKSINNKQNNIVNKNVNILLFNK